MTVPSGTASASGSAGTRAGAGAGTEPEPSPDGPRALADVRAGGKRAIARALARIEATPREPTVTALLDAALARPQGHALGLTGPPGVGKSTLIRALIADWRGAGLTVGVIAVDPSSRRTGGALLGDRTRLGTDPDDNGLFVRSMAARDRLGGLAEITFPAMVLMRALFDRVIVETVGVGQSETEIAGLCDTVLYCAQPGSGDALQYMKAGIIEIPDIVLVTKADLGAMAQRTVADLKGALSLTSPGPDGEVPQVLSCSAVRDEGLAELARALDTRIARIAPGMAERHAAQVRLWHRSHLAEAYGRAGLRALAALLPADTGAGTAPFTNAARLSEQLDGAFDRLTGLAGDPSGTTAAGPENLDMSML